MQLRNPFLFGLVAVLLIGGTVLPAMSQTPSEEVSQLEVNLDNSSYELNQPISISGQIIDFEKNNHPTQDIVSISFINSLGQTVSAGTYGQHSDAATNTMSESNTQPLIFKALPDQSGNFQLTTVLNSVLFDYGTYTVKVTGYQNGKITTTSEFEIIDPSAEVSVVEQVSEPFVYDICSLVKENLDDELSSTECSTSNDFRIGEKLIIKGKVPSVSTGGQNCSENLTTVCDTDNTVGSESSSGIAPKFVTVTFPYPKAMVAVVSDGFVTTTGHPVMKEQIDRLKDVRLTLVPDNERNFAGSIDLRNNVFESGIFAVSVSYGTENYETTVRIISDDLPDNTEAELVITTDKTEYNLGDTVTISGEIQNSYYADTVTIFVKSPDVSQYNCSVIDCHSVSSETKIIPEAGLTTHTFSWDFQITSSEVSIGKYEINAESVGLEGETSFFVVEEPVLIETAPTAQEAISPKKMIKKFNRISDSNIPIALNEISPPSELCPRVIQGSLFTTARGQEADVNLQVSTSDGTCVIGQEKNCMVSESTRKPGAIYQVVTIGEESFKIRYTGTDVRLEKFSILPEASGAEIMIKDWNIEIIKDDQPTRFYYKVSFVDLE